MNRFASLGEAKTRNGIRMRKLLLLTCKWMQADRSYIFPMLVQSSTEVCPSPLTSIPSEENVQILISAIAGFALIILLPWIVGLARYNAAAGVAINRTTHTDR